MDVTVHRLAHQSAKYLHDLGFPATELKDRRDGVLPYYLADAFDLVELDIAGQTVVLAIDEGGKQSPAQTEQQMRKLGELIQSTAVYVTGSLNSYDRRRLIERRVPFLVPGNQLYLPGLGMDLREHFRKPTVRRQLSPSAQAILIAILQHPKLTTELTASEIAAKLDYTPMTASRAARELAAADLAGLNKASNGQLITLIEPPKDTWERALPLMRSPVLRIVHVKMLNFESPLAGLGVVVRAGMSALTHSTMLAHEGPDVFACSSATWKDWKDRAAVLPRADENTIEVQIWSYPPTISVNGTGATSTTEVDPLSLYLSLRDVDDPRAQAALEELMEQVWR